MLRLHQLKDTDGSGNEGRNVVGNFPVEEVARRTFRGYVFLLQSTTNCYFISSILYFFWFIADVAARGSYVGHFKPCIFIHEFEITLHIQNYVV